MSRMSLLILLIIMLFMYMTGLFYWRLKKEADKARLHKRKKRKQEENKFFSDLENDFKDTKNDTK